MPTVLCAVQTLIDLSDERVSNLNSKYQNGKKSGPLLKASNETRKSLLSFAKYFAPEVEKVYSLDEKSEKSSLIRTIATSTPRRIAWRDFRSWLVGEGGSWEANDHQGSNADEEMETSNGHGEEKKGTLKIQGWIRGNNLSSNRLVHIPDFGDFQVDQIRFKPILDEKSIRRFEKLREKRAQEEEKKRNGEEIKEVEMVDADSSSNLNGTESEVGEEETPRDLLPDDLLDSRDEEFADDLVSENEVDDLANEQTWPTEEEMKGHLNFSRDGEDELDQDSKDMPPPAAPGTTPFKIEKNGKGKSKGKGEGILSDKYKAAWIVESDDEHQDDEDNLDDDIIQEEQDAEMIDKEPELEESGIISGDEEVATEMGFDEDEEEYQLALKAYSEERARLKSEREDLNFPDEVDTPLTISARKRFERYRGLKSFRTSPWILMKIYLLIIQRFFNLMIGREVWIKDAPLSMARRAGVEGSKNDSDVNDLVPFTLFGLMRHEHKKSVLNFTCTRNTEYEGTVKSKDPLILSLGPRRFKINPIFSQHTRSTGSNNVHKFERFLRPGVGSISVCSIFAPVTFGSPSAVLFKERTLEGVNGYDQRGVGARQMPYLVGSGNLLSAEPTRINAKRIVLTGHPFKVHKKTATIRFMFFNPEDVRYFQPVTLHTKYGRTGHIKDSLGTHGYFKAHFDGPINQMDTIMLTLYKRVFPKWSGIYTDSRDEMPLKISQEDQAGNVVGGIKGLKEDQRLGWNEMEAEKEKEKNGAANGAADGEDEEMLE
ncbi:hypothetical protein L7F22_015968 [Adiantum nelumboides]|nr:hypothetical protein [Adiantum nelumboides]